MLDAHRPCYAYREKSPNARYAIFATRYVLPVIFISNDDFSRKMMILADIARQLIKSREMGAGIADTSAPHDPDEENRISLWNALVEAGLVREFPGNEFRKRLSHYYPTNQFKKLYLQWQIDSIAEKTIIDYRKMNQMINNLKSPDDADFDKITDIVAAVTDGIPEDSAVVKKVIRMVFAKINKKFGLIHGNIR
jgi:hypothetical protein